MNKKTIIYFSLAGITALALILVLVGKNTELQAKSANPEMVFTKEGWVKGKVMDKYRSFLGIPYAAPPKGPFRWKSPQPVKPWKEVKDATKPGSPCPQLPTSYANLASTEEDCLCLNVITPVVSDRQRLKPVMVWIHGDGTVGAGHVFNPLRLVELGDVVVVTINYRLGIFSGFGYPGLDGSGTFGLQDQQAALKWVQRNIASFGGTPNNVTLFGVSYGGLATAAQLISPLSKGLFHKAIIQSGFTLMDMPAGSIFPGIEALPWVGWRSQKEIKELGKFVAEQLKSKDLKSLRQIAVKDLLPFSSMFQMHGYHSKVLPILPEKALANGDFNRIPVLAGNTLDEHRTFVSLFRILAGNPITKEKYRQLLDSAFAEQAGQIQSQYPVSAFYSPATAWATVLTDRMWAKATYKQHQLLSQHIPVYAYEFADRQAPVSLPFPKDLPAGAYHFSEVDYLLGEKEFYDKLSTAQQQLSDLMIQYWTNFARNGNPNGPGLPVWRNFQHTDTIPTVQSLVPGTNAIGTIDYYKEHQLAFWEKLHE